MLFRGKLAYPIYLEIGNIPKDICQKLSRNVLMVIGYIPTTKLEGILNDTARCRSLVNMFHSCMEHLLAPIQRYGVHGLVMMSSDGIWRCCHPIFTSFVGNYPEQGLVTCTYNGHCPKCLVASDRLGNFEHFPA